MASKRQRRLAKSEARRQGMWIPGDRKGSRRLDWRKAKHSMVRGSKKTAARPQPEMLRRGWQDGYHYGVGHYR